MSEPLRRLRAGVVRATAPFPGMDDTATSHVGRVASRQAGLGQLPGYLDPGTLEAVTQGDRTLATWRADHEAFFRSHDPRGRGFRPDTPVVLERVRVLHP